jgi:hypothetical protein
MIRRKIEMVVGEVYSWRVLTKLIPILISLASKSESDNRRREAGPCLGFSELRSKRAGNAQSLHGTTESGADP